MRLFTVTDSSFGQSKVIAENVNLRQLLFSDISIPEFSNQDMEEIVELAVNEQYTGDPEDNNCHITVRRVA